MPVKCMHAAGYAERGSHGFIEEVSSDLPSAFTAFHSMKGWEVFLPSGYLVTL